jgi:hypothetical protein
MLSSEVCLRLLAYSKASLLRSLEGLTQEDLLWQPAKGRNSIGWNAGHVGQFRGAFMWFFDAKPNWVQLGPLLAFGYGGDPDQTRDAIPPKAELIRLIHEDWPLVLERLRHFSEDDFAREVPLNNPDGETLFEMVHRTSWHADHHVGRICALRADLGKPAFPRPTFGSRARRALQVTSESQWEKVLACVDHA